MKNKLLVNIFFYGLGDFLVTAISAFLLIPVYVKHLTTEEYGILNIINTNTALFTYIFQFGVISAFARLFFQYKNNKSEYLNSILLFHLLFSILILILTYCCSGYIFEFLSPSIRTSKYVYVSVIIGWSAFIPALYYGLLRVEQKARSFFLFQIVTSLLLLGFISYHIFFSRLTIGTLFFSLVWTNIFIWLAISIIFSFKFKLVFNLKMISSTLKLGLPIFSGYIAYFFISKYSMLILQKYISLKELGVFGFAQQIAMIPTLISAIIGKAIQPFLFSSSDDQEFVERASVVDRAYKFFLLWFITGLIFFIDTIFNRILPQSYISAIPIIQALLAVNLIYNLFLVESSILLFKFKSTTILSITLIGSITNVMLSQILVGIYKVNGAILATLIAFTITFALYIIRSRRHLRIRYNIFELSLSTLILVSFFVISNMRGGQALSHFNFSFRIIGFLILSLMLFLTLKNTQKKVNASAN